MEMEHHHNGYYYPAIGAVLGAAIGLLVALLADGNVAWGMLLGGAAGIVVFLVSKTVFHWA
jgi:hypothetical protein